MFYEHGISEQLLEGYRLRVRISILSSSPERNIQVLMTLKARKDFMVFKQRDLL